MLFLGIDTSNYTTSLSLVQTDENGNITSVISKRKILDVKEGELGLRQSEAHFIHTKQIPELSLQLFSDYRMTNGRAPCVTAIGCSDKPRNKEGSYMPCFIAGKSAASLCADALGVPLYFFSHQCMHIASALYSCQRLDLFSKEHLAYHISGGTTELLHVTPDENGFCCEIIGKTLDISAGQLIDRCGVMLGLKFPCGAELERIADGNDVKAKVSVKGCDMNLSGCENICKEMKRQGKADDVIAGYAINTVARSIYLTTKNALDIYPSLPVVFAGGVSSDGIIREYLSKRIDCEFASVELSSDNAVGTAILAQRKYTRSENNAKR